MMTSPTLSSFGSPELALEVPQCTKGIGTVITDAHSPELIAGVQLHPIQLWPDDRGYFLEIMRGQRGAVADYPLERTQVSCAFSYPGIIKAFHYHLLQTDCWVPAVGMFQVVLVDFRIGSSTFGLRNTLYLGALRSWQVRIPPGVGHGYKVIGPDPGVLIYVTDQTYNPKDEGRVTYNDPGIAYDWELQHK